MSDLESIQGLWRLKSSRWNGEEREESLTHCWFGNGHYKEFVPHLVDDGKQKITFELNESSKPKRLLLRIFPKKMGKFTDEPTLVRPQIYRLEGNRLEICAGGWDFPAEFTDQNGYGIKTFERDFGPTPETRRPSGRKPIEDELLGLLEWDDNIHQFEGCIVFAGLNVRVAIAEKDGDVAPTLDRAKAIVTDLEHHSLAAKQYAASEMLESANDWREGKGEPITLSDFVARATLEGIEIGEDGHVTFWYGDGDMFWGHWIEVVMDQDDNPIDAAMQG